MTKIEANNYTVFIGDEALVELNDFLANQYSNSKKVVLVDENTAEYCYSHLALLDELNGAEIIQIESGEENKILEVTAQLWSTLNELGIKRSDVLINLGGGVIGDMGGFVASTYKRGIDFINIPTTLLAQVDASVGGKLGIDFDGLKNQIGVFNTPKALFVYPDFLQTLPNNQLLSGFAETIKHALIEKTIRWEELKSIELPKGLQNQELIEQSIETKNKIVLQDPTEKGLRKALNFGHTIGHAIESYSLENDEAPLLHGEAIAVGMICEAYISSQQCGLSQSELQDISNFILKVFGKYSLSGTTEQYLKLMQKDKKNETDEINFTLLEAIGKCAINHTATPVEIEQAVNFYISL